MSIHHELSRLDQEIDLLCKVAKENFWIGFVVGAALAGLITWACVS